MALRAFHQRQIDSNLGEASHSSGSKRIPGTHPSYAEPRSVFSNKQLRRRSSLYRDLIAVWDSFRWNFGRGRVNEFELPAVPVSETRQVDLFCAAERPEETLEVDPWPSR